MQILISENAKLKEKMICSKSKELIIGILAHFFIFQNADNMFATKLSGPLRLLLLD